MSLALIDCPTGLAGNMLLAALLDLGVPQEVLHEPLARLGLEGSYRLVVEERRSGGLRGLHLHVHCEPGEAPHRAWGELRGRILEAPWQEQLRRRVMEVFTLLAEAEGRVHGHAPESIHFHEVGAIDALVDIVGVCAGFLHLGITALICCPPPPGRGTVATAHGLLPVPAPAVLEMARMRGIPLRSSEGFPSGELTTPTGLALAACWAERFGSWPTAAPLQLGVGLGSRSLDRPNLLRLVLASPWQTSTPPQREGGEVGETLLVQEAQIDDATAEDLSFLIEELRTAGALEVFSAPILMKKGRQGTLITALARPDRSADLRRVWWRHSTTLGVREQLQHRWILPRDQQRIPTPMGSVRIKRAQLPGGGERHKLEHEDLARLARRHDLSLEEVRAAIRSLPEEST